MCTHQHAGHDRAGRRREQRRHAAGDADTALLARAGNGLALADQHGDEQQPGRLEHREGDRPLPDGVGQGHADRAGGAAGQAAAQRQARAETAVGGRRADAPRPGRRRRRSQSIQPGLGAARAQLRASEHDQQRVDHVHAQVPGHADGGQQPQHRLSYHQPQARADAGTRLVALVARAEVEPDRADQDQRQRRSRRPAPTARRRRRPGRSARRPAPARSAGPATTRTTAPPGPRRSGASPTSRATAPKAAASTNTRPAVTPRPAA